MYFVAEPADVDFGFVVTYHGGRHGYRDSWDSLAHKAGTVAPRLAPGDHPANRDLDIALYWPEVPAW